MGLPLFVPPVSVSTGTPSSSPVSVSAGAIMIVVLHSLVRVNVPKCGHVFLSPGFLQAVIFLHEP